MPRLLKPGQRIGLSQLVSLDLLAVRSRPAHIIYQPTHSSSTHSFPSFNKFGMGRRTARFKKFTKKHAVPTLIKISPGNVYRQYEAWASLREYRIVPTMTSTSPNAMTHFAKSLVWTAPRIGMQRRGAMTKGRNCIAAVSGHFCIVVKERGRC